MNMQIAEGSIYGAIRKSNVVVAKTEGEKTTIVEISCNKEYDKTYNVTIDGKTSDYLKDELYNDYEIIENRGKISKGYGGEARKTNAW